MTQRERSMVLVLCTVGGFVVLFGGFIGVQQLLDNLNQKDDRILSLQKEITTRKAELQMLAVAEQRWRRWQSISLPPDISTANNRYKSYLQELSRKHQLDIRSVTETGTRASTGRGSAGTGMSPLQYSLVVEGTLGQLINFMKDYYTINLPHQIRDVAITPTPRGNGPDTRLEATLKLEAVALAGIPQRDFLPAIPDEKALRWDIVAGLAQVPAGLASALWSLGPVGLYGGESKLAAAHQPARDYAQLVKKNIFVGLAAPPKVAEPPKAVAVTANREVLKYVRLTDIVVNNEWREAGLYNQRLNKQIRLRAESGKDTFTVRDANNLVILNGQVRQINRRDMIILVDGKHYSVHVGEDLQQALQSELSEEELKTLAGL